MKHVRSLLVAAVTLVLGTGAHAQEFVTVLTGGTSAACITRSASALSQIYGKALPGAKTAVQATKASAENLNLLQAGKRREWRFTLGDALNGRLEGRCGSWLQGAAEQAARPWRRCIRTTSRSGCLGRFRHQEPG
jgi:hypothetical protein